jgi:hypothetical protein
MTASVAANAIDLWRDGDRYIEASGSIRELLTATNGTDGRRFSQSVLANGCLDPAFFVNCPAFELVGDRDTWQSLARLRVQFDAGFADGWSGKLVYDFEWRAGILDGLFGVAGGVEDSFLGLEDRVGPATDRHAQVHRVYRGWLRFEEGPLQVTVGRQRIPWGVGRLWNPIDRFNAIGPLAIEGDQSLGIDAIDVRWSFSGFDQLQLVYAPATRSADARYAVRYQAVVRDVDVGLMVGRFEQALTAGLDLAGNIGDSAWRIEAVWTEPSRIVRDFGRPPRELDAFWQVVVSLDHNFDLGTGLYVLVEHLWDQNALGLGQAGRAGSLLPFFQASGVPVSPDRFGGSGVVSLVSHQTGFSVGYELTSAVNANVLLLWDWRGESAAVAPALTFTGYNSVELSIGTQLFVGADRSQYGGQEALAYALVEWFF